MSKERRISLKDVAESVGVSTALVSMVLNGKARQYRISDEVAKKVIETAKQMNYAPNLMAQNLRSGKTRLIGLVVTDISNPFYSSIARIIEDRANELNYTVLIGSTDEDPENTERLVEVLQNKGVEGLIIVPCDGSKEFIQELYDSKFPTVLLDRYFPDIDLSSSCLDNFKSTQLATQHLLDQGYENIALIAYNTQMQHILDRIKGYEDVMLKAGLDRFINVKKINILNPKPEICIALNELINEQHVDAVMFLTNMLATNGLYCLNELKTSIPSDLAIIGFNGNDAFNLFYSPVTYVKQPIEEIAKSAIDVLIEHIDDDIKAKNLFLEPELVVQKSSLRI